MVYFDGEEFNNAIITPPASACSAVAASGTTKIGEFTYKVAYVNKYGQISALGVASAVADYKADAAGDAQNMNLTSVPTSSDSQVVKRYIYRKADIGYHEQYYEHEYEWYYATWDNRSTVFKGTEDEYVAAGTPSAPNSAPTKKRYLGRTEKYRYRQRPGLSSDYLYIGEIADNTTTTFTDDVSMSDAIGNATEPPSLQSSPPVKPFLTGHKDRLFAFGGITYATGTLSVTEDSDGVTGSGTDWQVGMAGSTLQIETATDTWVEVEVKSVGSTTAITLTENWTGSTDSGLSYKLYTPRNELMWSRPGKYGEFLPENFVNVGNDDGDYGTGSCSLGSILLLFKRRHIYALNYTADPNRGRMDEIENNIGAVSHWSIVPVGKVSYFLGENGIYRTTGGTAQELSRGIRDKFRKMDLTKRHKFHAVHHAKRKSVMFFYVKNGDSYPGNCIVYFYESGRIQEYSFLHSVIGSCSAEDENGDVRTYLATYDGTNTRVWGYDCGNTDGADPDNTYQGEVDLATADTISDDDATFPTTDDGLDGAYLTIEDASGATESLLIASNTGTTITVSTSFTLTPVKYYVGIIETKAVMGNFDMDMPTKKKALTYIEVYFEPLSSAEYLKMRLYYDGSSTAFSAWSARSEDGVTIAESTADVKIDLSTSSGVVRVPCGDVSFYSVKPEFRLDFVEANVDIRKIVFDYKELELGSKS